MPPYTVSYRCQYRDYWYEAAVEDDFYRAMEIAIALQNQYGRAVAITDGYGQQVFFGN